MGKYLLAFALRSLYLLAVFCFFDVAIHVMMGHWHGQWKLILSIGLFYAPLYSAYVTWKTQRRQRVKLAKREVDGTT